MQACILKGLNILSELWTLQNSKMLQASQCKVISCLRYPSRLPAKEHGFLALPPFNPSSRAARVGARKSTRVKQKMEPRH